MVNVSWEWVAMVSDWDARGKFGWDGNLSVEEFESSVEKFYHFAVAGGFHVPQTAGRQTGEWSIIALDTA